MTHGTSNNEMPDILALSTEDGRILLYSTASINIPKVDGPTVSSSIPTCEPFGQIGEKISGSTGRVKDFEILKLPTKGTEAFQYIFIAGSSDGSVRLWTLKENYLELCSTYSTGMAKPCNEKSSKADGNLGETNHSDTESPAQIGQLLGTYETCNRITCLKAFVMKDSSAPENLVDDGVIGDFNGFEADSDKSSSI